MEKLGFKRIAKKMGGIKRVAAMTTLLVICFVMPEVANAKYSKASADFSYNGVTVKVVDRRNQMGRSHHNTYGYADYENRNDVAVTVDWRCYGILKDCEKMVLLNENQFVLDPKEKRGEVYSYGAGHFRPNDFEKYVISIQVTKDKPLESVAEPLDSKAAEKLAAQGKSGNLTQDEYSKCIDTLDDAFDNTLKDVYAEMDRMRRRGDEAGIDRLTKQYKGVFTSFAKLANMLDDAEKKGKLNAENQKKYTKLKNKVEKFMEDY